jgi:hypothetical protein
MASDGNVFLGCYAELPRRHAQLATVTADDHRLRRTPIKLLVKPADERGRSWFRQIARSMSLIDLTLQADMRPCLQLQVAAFLSGFELSLQRRLDLTRRGVVALDQSS